MGATTTGSLLAFALACTILFGWLGARPPNPLRGPRLAPYRLLMAFGAVAVIALGQHLVAVLRGGAG